MPEVNSRNRKKLVAQFANWYVASCDDMDTVLHLAEKRVLSWFDGMTNEQVANEFAVYEFLEEEEANA